MPTSTSRWSRARCAPTRSRSRGCGGSTFAAGDPKGGGVEHGPRIFSQPTCHHAPEVYGGIEEVRAGALLREFFESRR
jgi:tRNA(Arg) A34 adenosine deaminase TadA